MKNNGGQLSFIRLQLEAARVCAFHPKDPQLFVVGGKSEMVQLTNAVTRTPLRTTMASTSSIPKRINGLSFVADGDKMVVSSESRRVTVVDVERGTPVIAYENCATPASARQPIAVHPHMPTFAACVSVNGRGLTLLDTRMPLPFDYLLDLYETPIGDLAMLNSTWPWGSGQVSLLSGGDGEVKVTTLRGLTHLRLSVGLSISALAHSPGAFGASRCHGYKSVIVAAGEYIACHEPSLREATSPETFKNHRGSVLRAKYSCGGGLLYTASKCGSVARFRRYPDHHDSLGELYSHSGPVTDFDLSPFGDFIVSVSPADERLSLYTLGSPSHGHTQCWELT